MSHPPRSPQLSPEGRTRRDAMLPELIGAMQDVHRSRHRRRRAGAVTLLAAVAVVVGVIAAPRTPNATRLVERAPAPVTPAPAAPDSTAAPTPNTLDAPAWEIVRGAPISPDWIVRSTRPSRVELIDDAALIAELATMDRPTGVVRMGDDVWLTREPDDPTPSGEPTSDRGGAPVAHASFTVTS